MSKLSVHLIRVISGHKCITWSDFEAFKSREIRVHMGDLIQSIDMVFITQSCVIILFLTGSDIIRGRLTM